MAGPRPKDQLAIQIILVQFIITAILTATAQSLVQHFIRPVQTISRRPMSVNIFSEITAQVLFESWIPQQVRPLVLSPAQERPWTCKLRTTVASITSLWSYVLSWVVVVRP